MSPLPEPLPEDDRQTLLRLARQALVEAVAHGQRVEVPPARGELARTAGVFVTLHMRGRLRGCVGLIESPEPLPETVARCAVSAALEDPRFDPMLPAELPEVEIEISVLSPLEAAAPEQIEVGRHGLVVTRGWLRGLLLPQVATERGWSAERFLEETCVKAGLEREAWKDPATRIEIFTAEVFSEPPRRRGEQARAS